MLWVSIIFFLTLNNLSEARHVKKLPSAVVVGTVYCDTCFQDDFSKNSHFITGASVAVECNDENSKPSFRQEVKTDEHGEFKVHLPFSVSKHVRKIKRCSVKLLSSSEPYCAVASTATSSSLHLKSRKQGMHIFSAGFFTFKPEKQPTLCNQKPSIQNSRAFNTKKISEPANPPFVDPSFPPPLQDPPTPLLPPADPIHIPPVPLLPTLPPLPQLPPLPGVPNVPPLPGKTSQTKATKSFKNTQLSEQKVSQTDQFGFPFPPILPPFPGLTPPAPLFPPLTPPAPLIPPFTPPAPLIPLPPIPGLTPPPPPPSFPIPLPPFPALPFPPLPPPIPGIPPASSTSSSSQKNSP